MGKRVVFQQQTLSAADVAEFLGISRSGAYVLMHACDFPSIRIGGRLLITRVAFDRWVEAKQQNRGFDEVHQQATVRHTK